MAVRLMDKGPERGIGLCPVWRGGGQASFQTAA